MDLMVKERRKTQRIPCTMTVGYKVIRRGSVPSEDENFVKTLTRDISERGLGLILDEEFMDGDIIRVDFELGGRKLEAVCEIMWCNEIYLGERNRQFAAGAEFSCLTTDEQRHLEGYFRMRFESIWDYLMNPER